MKKFLTACLLAVSTLPSFANAEITLTPQEQRSFIKAVENSIYSHVNNRNNVLAIGSAYAYENKNLKDLSLEEIKLYSPMNEEVIQCLFNSVTPKSFEKPLAISFNEYLKQVDRPQFEADKTFITDPKRQKSYRLQREIMKIYSSITPISNLEFANKPVSAGTKAKIDKKIAEITKLTKQLPEKDGHRYLNTDVDTLMENMGNETTDPNDHSALANLLGLSIANVPFDKQETKYPASEMSIYSQNVLDTCHKPLWKQVYDESHKERE